MSTMNDKDYLPQKVRDALDELIEELKDESASTKRLVFGILNNKFADFLDDCAGSRKDE